MTLLSIRNLSVEFHTEEGIVRAVNEVSFDIPRGKTVCLVGDTLRDVIDPRTRGRGT